MALVMHILEAARKRLAVLSREASLFDAARILANRDTPLIVVCDGDGIAVGVISTSHVINVLATTGVDALGLDAGAIPARSSAERCSGSSAPLSAPSDFMHYG